MSEIEIKNKKYIESDELEAVAKTVIKKEKLQICPPAVIKYIKVYPHITKTKHGCCLRTSNELRMFSGAHYLIEMSGDLWDKLDTKTRYILMYHELLHPYPIMNERRGEWEYKLRDHDIRDFYEIISKYGIDWFSNLRVIVSSVYDLTPDQKSSIVL